MTVPEKVVVGIGLFLVIGLAQFAVIELAYRFFRWRGRRHAARRGLDRFRVGL